MQKKNCVIFGASKLGGIAYDYLEDQYNIIAFFDNDQKKWGTTFKDKPVENPIKSVDLCKSTTIIIASSYSLEIMKQLNELGVYSFRNFQVNLQNSNLENSVAYWKDDLSNISMGSLMSEGDYEKTIDNLTFISGSSNILDYYFLSILAQKFNVKKYLEIGTFTGESMAVVSKYTDQCYSITLSDESEMTEWMFKKLVKKKNFNRYFCKDIPNIEYFFESSLEFNYGKLPTDLDLVFIDGDHSYDAIKKDTENVINHIKIENCIVVWHDVKNHLDQVVYSTVAPILEGLPNQLHKNFFLVDRNKCGIYIPDKYLNEFKYNEKNDEIYSYEIQVKSKLNII